MKRMDAVIYIHGKGGNAAEAEHYNLLFPSCNVTGLEYKSFTPWEAGMEIHAGVAELNAGFDRIILIANSIGAYFSMNADIERYVTHVFPDASDWTGRILLLESSEEKPTSEKYRRALSYLKEAGVFVAVSGVLVGKPMDGTYAGEYKQLLVEVIDHPELPVLFNINVGHALPRCIIPFGVDAVVDSEKQTSDSRIDDSW